MGGGRAAEENRVDVDPDFHTSSSFRHSQRRLPLRLLDPTEMSPVATGSVEPDLDTTVGSDCLERRSRTRADLDASFLFAFDSFSQDGELLLSLMLEPRHLLISLCLFLPAIRSTTVSFEL